jgi:hypothetical protein
MSKPVTVAAVIGFMWASIGFYSAIVIGTAAPSEPAWSYIMPVYCPPIAAVRAVVSPIPQLLGCVTMVIGCFRLVRC